MAGGTTNPNARAAVRHDLSHDLGTCWTLTRQDCVARCALFASDDEWELRVIVNDEPLLWKRCRRAEDILGISEDWKTRMLEHGWAVAAPGKSPVPIRRG